MDDDPLDAVYLDQVISAVRRRTRRTLSIPDHEWRPCGPPSDPRGVLQMSITLNGVGVKIVLEGLREDLVDHVGAHPTLTVGGRAYRIAAAGSGQ